MTQKEMAQKINVDPKTIRNWRETRPYLLELIKLGLEMEEMKKASASDISQTNNISGDNVNNITLNKTVGVGSVSVTENQQHNNLAISLCNDDKELMDIVNILKQLPQRKLRKIRLQAEMELITHQEEEERR